MHDSVDYDFVVDDVPAMFCLIMQTQLMLIELGPYITLHIGICNIHECVYVYICTS